MCTQKFEWEEFWIKEPLKYHFKLDIRETGLKDERWM